MHKSRNPPNLSLRNSNIFEHFQIYYFLIHVKGHIVLTYRNLYDTRYCFSEFELQSKTMTAEIIAKSEILILDRKLLTYLV